MEAFLLQTLPICEGVEAQPVAGVDIGGTNTKYCIPNFEKKQLELFLTPTYSVIKSLGVFKETITRRQITRVVFSGGGTNKHRDEIQRMFSDTSIELDYQNEVSTIESTVQMLFSWKDKGAINLHGFADPDRQRRYNMKSLLSEGLDREPERDFAEVFSDRKYLIVNIGSGVSVISGESMKRIDGSALGGTSFVGLSRALMGWEEIPFDELVEIAVERGDFRNNDMSVGDIVGNNEYVGLGSGLTASWFGKAGSGQIDRPPSKEDMVSSLFMMTTWNIAQIAVLNCKVLGYKKILFTGMLVNENERVRSIIDSGVKYWSRYTIKGYYFDGSGFVGVLGSALR